MEKPVALITGGIRGIGLGAATHLADLGYNLAIDDIQPLEDIEETVTLLEDRGATVHYINADISKTQGRETIITQVKKTFGRLDLLMNNAGVAPKVRLDILQGSEESFDRVLNINLKGPYFLTQLVANWMIDQKQERPDDNFYIINTASLSSYASSPARGEYCVSKAGVSMMTKLYADRLAEYGILVYEIRPGIIETDMTSVVKEKYDKLIAEGLLPIKRWGTPDDIGRAVEDVVNTQQVQRLADVGRESHPELCGDIEARGASAYCSHSQYVLTGQC